MDTSNEWVAQLDEAVAGVEPLLRDLRRELHQHPEPSGEEWHTSLRVESLLREAGFGARLGPDQRGVITDSEAPLGTPRIALRADLDALRIEDAKSVDDAPYRSQRAGVMHACGHDAHTATVLGALLALRKVELAGGLPISVAYRGIFQPAEETAVGALDMIKAGALEDVAGIFSIHSDPSRPVGTIGLRDEAFTAACDSLTIHLTGRGGHAARPHESLDPIAAAAQLISSIYLFLPRSVDSQEPVVVTIGQFVAGDSANVIPESAVLRGTIRTLGVGARKHAQEQVRRLARGIAEASGVQIDVHLEPGPPSVRNDPAANRILKAAAELDPVAARVQWIPRPSMGGEDFAFYLGQTPGAMLRLGCARSSLPNRPLHSPLFDIDEAALAVGARILARAVVLASLEATTSPKI